MEVLENTGSPIDFERLREVSADDVELMNELIELYFSQTRELLDQLKTAITEKNADSVYQSAHKALGSSLTCGMNAVVSALKKLEQIGRSNNFENAEEILSEAGEGFAEMDSYLQNNREQLLN